MDRRREPAAAGATMTSSHDPDEEAGKREDARKDCSDSHAVSDTARTTATGKSQLTPVCLILGNMHCSNTPVLE